MTAPHGPYNERYEPIVLPLKQYKGPDAIGCTDCGAVVWDCDIHDAEHARRDEPQSVTITPTAE